MDRDLLSVLIGYLIDDIHGRDPFGQKFRNQLEQFSGTFISKILVNLSRFSIFPKYRKFRNFPGVRFIQEKKSEFSVQNQIEQ